MKIINRMYVSLGLFLFLGIEDSNAQTYKAAVVAFRQDKKSVIPPLPDELEVNNKNRFIALITDFKTAGADIVVFPEKAITSLAPDSIDKQFQLNSYSIDVPNPSPATNFSNNILSGISAAARANQVHVVINVLEIQIQDKSTDYFSTSIVFDAEGKIVLKCRKKHLYKELKYSRSSSDDLCTFEANFSGNRKVKFALLFDTDLLYTVKDDTIHNAILTSSLPNALPFLFGVSLQVGTSVRNQINLLAAGYTDTDQGYGGTGIYYGNGTSRVTFGSESFIVDNVPLTQSREKKISVIATVSNNTLRSVSYTESDIPTLTTSEKTVKQDIGEGRSCNMEVKMDGNDIQPYAWVATKNISFFNPNRVMSFCGLIKPKAKKDQKSLVNNAQIEISIQGDIEQVLPVSLGKKSGDNTDAQYPTKFTYEETKTGDVTKISMVLTEPNDLSGFGVIIVNKSGGTLIRATHMVLIGSLIFVVFFRSRLFM